MRIPVGDFGYKPAGTAPGGDAQARVNPQAFDTGAGAALIQGGREIMAEAKQIRAEQEHEEKRKLLEAEAERRRNEEQARRNTAAASFAQYQVDLNELTAGVSQRLTDGVLNRDAAKKELEDAMAALRKKHIEPLDPLSQDTLKDNLILFDGRARLGFQTTLQQHAKSERAGAYTDAREAFQRLALTDRAGAIRQMETLAKTEGAALFGAEKATKDLQAFKEQVTFTDLDRRISASQNNGRALAELQKELASPAYADLAPERRNFLESKIMGRQQHIAHMGEVAERRRMAGLEQQTRRLSWYVENGRDIPMAEFDKYVKASKGTPYEGTADMLIAEQKAVSEFMRLSPSQMVAKVKDLEKSYGATPSKEQITHLDKVKKFTERSIKLGNDSPLDYAVARDGARIEPLDVGNPATWAGNLAARTAVLTEQSSRTGFAPKGLFPQEAAALTQYLRDAPVADKTRILTALRQGFGDDKVYRATMQQIAPDDPVLAVAGVAAGRGLESQRDKALSDLILRGQMVLRPNKKEDGSPGKAGMLPMPKDDVMLREFESYARDAFAGHEQARNAYLQTARAIYAAKAVEQGDFTGNLDSSRWRESMQLATGGIDKVNGRRIVLPWGRTTSQFIDELDLRVRQVEEAGRLAPGMTATRLRNLPLEVAGDGKYVFRSGDGIVVDKDRKPILLDFNESLPYVPSGERTTSTDYRPTTTKGRSSGK